MDGDSGLMIALGPGFAAEGARSDGSQLAPHSARMASRRLKCADARRRGRSHHSRSLKVEPEPGGADRVRGYVTNEAVYSPERVRPASARKKKLPAVTTSSPGFRPSSTSSESPRAAPSFTVRSAKRPSPPSNKT